jgi:four helix bundle protein
LKDTASRHAALPDAEGPPALLDAERLHVYRAALEFQGVVAGIRLPPALRDLRNQLDRASASIVLNVAEGAGRHAVADKAHFYAIARGSAMESAAVLDILAARGAATPEAHKRGRGLLLRVVQMLTRLRQQPVPPSTSPST